MKAGFVIEGAKELERNLATLEKRIQKKVVRQAVRAGQKPLLARAKANAVNRVGGTMGALIAKNLVIKAPRRQQKGMYSLHVQLRSGVSEFVHPTKSGRRHFIPADIEYGHGSDKEGAARPYARPATDATREESIRALTRALRTGLLREAIKGRSAQ